MREVFFRGKNMHGEWVIGQFLRSPFIEGGCCIQAKTPDGEGLTNYAVHAGSVGQFTGFRDKNDNPIFEGDIVRYQVDNEDCPFPSKDTKKRIGLIIWKAFRGSFALKCNPYMNDDLFRYVNQGNRVEVIGNFYDNPKLLKYGEEGKPDEEQEGTENPIQG